MLRRDAILASGGVFVAGSVVGCLGQPTGSAADNEEPSDSEASEITDDATLEATLEVGDDSRTLFTTGDIARVGAVATRPQTGPSVPIELTAAGTESVTETAAAVDLDSSYEAATVTLTFDGERINQFGINAELAAEMAGGGWGGRFVLTFADTAAADAFRDRLLAES
ncbi:hypothetical protein [Halonotius roseus]|uniref:Preprotein translocase subunit SecD n=1 Tax=Halonotius roseus TaxID=2511997 RepID=A0A544QRU4_9EURY|nr:hypothetical protein [Halonotius roseus]TQQ82184.1 hypothetical protein EWF95_04395 [Halonotius roseus]